MKQAPRWTRFGWISGALSALVFTVCSSWVYGLQAPAADNVRMFDAISIRPGGPSPDGRFCRGCMRPNEQDPKTLTMRNFTLRSLVCFAYIEDPGDCDFKLSDSGPSWFTSDYFNIVARTENPATPVEKREMMRNALTQYFHLVLRREVHTISGYVLQVTARGLKLARAIRTDKCGQIAISDKSDDHSLSRVGINADCASIDDIAAVIQQTVFRNLPVLNRTGLPVENRYEVSLDVATEKSAALDPATGPSVFSALPDQVGLELKAAKIPVEVLVIASAQHPDPN